MYCICNFNYKSSVKRSSRAACSWATFVSSTTSQFSFCSVQGPLLQGIEGLSDTWGTWFFNNTSVYIVLLIFQVGDFAQARMPKLSKRKWSRHASSVVD